MFLRVGNHVGPALWNDVPLTIRNICSVVTLKVSFKTCLFNDLSVIVLSLIFLFFLSEDSAFVRLERPMLVDLAYYNSCIKAVILFLHALR